MSTRFSKVADRLAALLITRIVAGLVKQLYEQKRNDELAERVDQLESEVSYLRVGIDEHIDNHSNYNRERVAQIRRVRQGIDWGITDESADRLRTDE